MIRTILHYDTVYTIYKLYSMIYKHFGYIKVPLGHNKVDR